MDFLFILFLTLQVRVATCLSLRKGQKEQESPNWSLLQSLLSENASIHKISSNTAYSTSCETLGTNAYAISAAANGICMHAHDCAYEFCHPKESSDNYDLPSLTIDVRNEDDVSNVLKFVHDNNIISNDDDITRSSHRYKSISVKTTGHSYQGSSTAKDSLLIWMYHFEKDGEITTNYENSCGDSYDVVGIGGGETWDDVLEAVKDNYHIVTGGGRTVSAAGGWLQGGGLSFSSRKYGLGVDNVIDYRVVLVDGTVVVADACTNKDLFWALRGGGGGTYGVVTHAHYKVHPVTPIVVLHFGIYGLENLQVSDFASFGSIVNQWLQYWISISPTLDTNWCGGFFSHTYLHLLYCGTTEDASTSLLDDFYDWYNKKLNKSGTKPGVWDTYIFLSNYDNWYEYKGGAEAAGNPDMTDPTGDAYKDVNKVYTRLMPSDYVISKPDEVLDLFFQTIETSFSNLNYFLGGNINTSDNETSVHPSLRSSIWSVFTNGDVDSEKVRSFIPNNVTGVCYNHHNVLEPDWRNACWGANYDPLNEIKNKYDPNRAFNCWHCVGYDGAESPESPSPSPSSSPTPTAKKENPYSRFLLRFSQDGQTPETKNCKWLSKRPNKAKRRICSSRRFQVYSQESNLAPASQTCSVTCDPYCVIEIQNARFILGTTLNEDGEIELQTRQCKFLKNKPASKVKEICANFVNIDTIYGQASEVCTSTCESCV